MPVMTKKQSKLHDEIRSDYKTELLHPGIKKGYIKAKLAIKYAVTPTTIENIVRNGK